MIGKILKITKPILITLVGILLANNFNIFSYFTFIPSEYSFEITTLQLFKKKISYRTLWCIISLPTKYTKESDPVR